MPNTPIQAAGGAMPANTIETPQEELRRLSTRMMELLKELDPRTEIATIRATGAGTTMMTGFDIPIPGLDGEAA